MQFQFPKKMLKCLGSAVEEIKDLEVTQELRLTEGMPDIGRVIAVWGQVMVRSKQWMDDEIGLTGGVKIWVLYAPEEDAVPRVTEGWIPFQMKWDVRCGGREGPVRMMPLLRYADARSTSARKIMLRAGIGVLAQGMYRMETEISVPDELPEQVQVLKRSYPVRLPREAGEKTFHTELDLDWDPGKNMISYAVTPIIGEARVIGDKVAFKGNAMVHLVICTEEGKIQKQICELPYSQLIDLEESYGADAKADVSIAVTDLEADRLEDDKIRIKCTMVGQYLVDDRQVLELAEDAYCPGRSLEYETAVPELPVVVETRIEDVKTERQWNGHMGSVADIQFLPDHPKLHQGPDRENLELSGTFQILHYRNDGSLQSSNVRWEENMQIPMDEKCRLHAFTRPTCNLQISSGVDGTTICGNLQLQIRTRLDQGVSMITSLELGQPDGEDLNRPSLILRKAGDDSLWMIAKSCGTTVDAIRNANGGIERSAPEQMLLIPMI